MNIFHSARLKLTAFYFAVLLAFCVALTVGISTLADYELERENIAERSSIQGIIDRLYDSGTSGATYSDFADAQERQADITRSHLYKDIAIVDILVLTVGAVLSYWYAGRALKPIEEAHEEQKRFTADASHELRTPLTSMRLENEVFLRQKHFDEAAARIQLASNLEEVGRLERLATNLLDLDQFEHAKLLKQPLKVADLCEESIDHVTHGKEAARAKFQSNLAPAKVLGDRESLVELLGILLDNAVKYGPKDGPIALIGHALEHQYVLKVRDHGPGIAEADLPHIFERLYRGDSARSGKVGGYGIGLSLARQIATANGVQIEAANHPEGGAVFSLVLPLAKHK